MTEKRVPRYSAPPQAPECMCSPVPMGPDMHYDECPLAATEGTAEAAYCRRVAAPPQEGRTPAPPEIEKWLLAYEDALGLGMRQLRWATDERKALLSAIGRALAGERARAEKARAALRELCDAIGEEDLERAQSACDCAGEAIHNRVDRALGRARALAGAPPETEAAPQDEGAEEER